MPRVYHKYVGHDNNRDFVVLTQEDTRVISRLYSTEWYPQVLVEKHQMGSTGPRYYVPPNHDPIAQVIDEGLWNWSAVFGANLSRDMTADGLQGVASHWLFDDYWPGSTETSHWKNIISFLTEAASCKTATPIFIEPTELSVRGKGLAEYKKGVNLPDPWPGGVWSLGDIVEYELSSMASILATAASNRVAILTFRNDLCRKEVEKGRTEAPYYFVLPKVQTDPGELAALAELLLLHGIEVEPSDGGHDRRPPPPPSRRPGGSDGAALPPLRQGNAGGAALSRAPLHARRRVDPPLRHHQLVAAPPHGCATRFRSTPVPESWKAVSNPSSKGRATDRFKAPQDVAVAALSPTANLSYKAAFAALAKGLPVRRLTAPMTPPGGTVVLPAGTFVVPAAALSEVSGSGSIEPLMFGGDFGDDVEKLKMPRIALVETFFHDMDAGWTRYLFDTYGIPYRVLNPGDFDDADLARDFDVIVFPDAEQRRAHQGQVQKGRSLRRQRLPAGVPQTHLQERPFEAHGLYRGRRHGRLLGRIDRSLHGGFGCP